MEGRQAGAGFARGENKKGRGNKKGRTGTRAKS